MVHFKCTMVHFHGTLMYTMVHFKNNVVHLKCTMVHFHGTLMYHDTFQKYHGTFEMYHGTFLYTMVHFNVPWYRQKQPLVRLISY